MSRGIQRERQVRKHLESPEGGEWWTARAAGSLGDADVIAGKRGKRPMLIEVKSSSKERGPFADFGPAQRDELLAAGRKTGFNVFLIWWPPRGPMQWIPPAEWPRRTS